MKAILCALAAASALAAQPKLLVNAQADTRSAAAGLEREFRTLLAAQPQPAWIGYSVPSIRGAGLGCEYVRDNPTVAGVVHLEPPEHAIVLLRVENQAVSRVRALSPYCEIDAGGVPVHWLNDVRPAESVALLVSLIPERSDNAFQAIAAHADPAAERALEKYLAPDQPENLRVRAVSALGRRPDALDRLTALATSEADAAVRRRAISALQSLPDGKGIPTLIQMAKTHRDPETRKQAMSSLQHSRDPRALAFFEEILKK